MFGKKSSGKVHQVHDGFVCLICPPAGKFKTVAGAFPFFYTPLTGFLYVLSSSGIAVVLGMRAVGDDKDLYVFKKPRTCPKTLALVAVNLVKSFLQCYATAFKLDMYQRQTIYQNGNIVAVDSLAAFGFVLINDLQRLL